MFEEISIRKANLGFVWTKVADSGNTYLCPAVLAGDVNSMTEDELRRLCVEESSNPHND
jgi:hypothetical protein